MIFISGSMRGCFFWPACFYTPFVEELSRPGGGVVIPELLKRFLEKIGADRLQVVAQQIGNRKR